jgi:hypothetical protein
MTASITDIRAGAKHSPLPLTTADYPIGTLVECTKDAGTHLEGKRGIVAWRSAVTLRVEGEGWHRVATPDRFRIVDDLTADAPPEADIHEMTKQATITSLLDLERTLIALGFSEERGARDAFCVKDVIEAANAGLVHQSITLDESVRLRDETIAAYRVMLAREEDARQRLRVAQENEMSLAQSSIEAVKALPDCTVRELMEISIQARGSDSIIFAP